MSADDIKPKSWRAVLPVHPAADLFPMMSESELRELGEDHQEERAPATDPLLQASGR
jgi:hypothetical protein